MGAGPVAPTNKIFKLELSLVLKKVESPFKNWDTREDFNYHPVAHLRPSVAHFCDSATV